jgi:hypothetical protein
MSGCSSLICLHNSLTSGSSASINPWALLSLTKKLQHPFSFYVPKCYFTTNNSINNFSTFLHYDDHISLSFKVVKNSSPNKGKTNTFPHTHTNVCISLINIYSVTGLCTVHWHAVWLLCIWPFTKHNLHLHTYITFHGSKISWREHSMWNKSYNHKNAYTIQPKHYRNNTQM